MKVMIQQPITNKKVERRRKILLKTFKTIMKIKNHDHKV